MKLSTILCLVLLWVCAVSTALAQGSGEAAHPELVSGATLPGLGYIRAGRWVQLHNTVTNPTNEAVQLVVASSVGNYPNVQFGTQVWLPPMSRRNVEILARVNEKEKPARRTSALSTQSLLLLPSEGGGERSWLSRKESQGVLNTSQMVYSFLGEVDDADYDVVTEARGPSSDEKALRTIRPKDAPSTVEAWRALEGLVIVSTPQLSPLQMRSLRQWVFSGGRVWIMLDRVDESFVIQLLGDQWRGAVVDRTELSRVVVGNTKQAGDVHAQPVTMVRVIAPEEQVIETVNQWPLALLMQAGQGKVLMTTLQSSAMRTAQLSSVLDVIGSELHRRPLENDNLTVAAGQMAAQGIGRQIVSRQLVLWTLVVLVIGMIVVGVLLRRQGRLEWMGAAGPALAILAAAFLLGVGKARQGQVPLTISSVSVVEVSPHQLIASRKAAVAVYSPGTEEGPLALASGGSLWPQFTGLQGRVVRLLATDLDQWKWQNVEFSAGAIRTGWLEQEIALTQPMVARGRFGPQGLELEVSLGGYGQLEDPLLLSPAGAATVRPAAQADTTPSNPGQSYVVPAGATMDKGQYVRAQGSLLTDRQQQRQAFYQAIFKRGNLPQQPSLAGWTRHLPLGLELPNEFELQNQSMLVIPIEFVPSQAGQRVVIPALFLPFAIGRRPGEGAPPTIYSANTREWITDLPDPARMVLEFDLPATVLPFKLEEASLQLTIRAPGRLVQVFDTTRSRGEPIASVTSPSGEITLDVSSLSQSFKASDTQVALILDIGPADNQQTWGLTDVSLQVAGQVLASSVAQR